MARRDRSLFLRLGVTLLLVQIVVVGVLSWFTFRTVLSVDTEVSIGSLLLFIGIVDAISIGVTALAVTVLSRSMAAAVARLGDSASRFASGGLTELRVEPPGKEFESLTNALNHMARQLSVQISQLKAQGAEMDAILRSMESGVVALDLGRRVLRMNRAAEELLGVRGAAARGQLLEELTTEPRLRQFVLDAFSHPGSQHEEFELDGPPRILVRAWSRNLRDAEGMRTGLLLVLADITRLRRLEDMRSDFAANVSHELRTPITNIRGYVETLQETGFDDPERTTKFVEVIARNTSRLGAIVEDMLALTRLEQPDIQETLERERVRVSEVVDAVCLHLEPDARERRITLERGGAEDLQFSVNPALVEQALTNLVGNAIKYSYADTLVTISASSRESAAGGEIVISVEDRGPGIAPEHLDRLFERFYRVDKARSRQMGGTGLGLAIVKHIALVHGGNVEVESDVGNGSTFRLVLPAEPAAVPA